MAIELYEHQLRAIERLKNGAILQGGVGSGKSRTALAYFYFKVCKGQLEINGKGEFAEMKHPRDLYIITTARKRDTLDWEKECAPFCLTRERETSVSGIQVTVDSWNNIKKYTEAKDAFFIFDEQRVVGYGAWTQAFLKITKNNLWILLSATPGDTWMDYLPVFIANGFYKSKNEFVKRHVIYSYGFTKFPRIDRYVETKRLERLRNDILVTMEYEKPTVPHHETWECEYDKALYRHVMRDRWDPWKDEPIQDVSGLCYVLRRVANGDPSRIDILEKILKDHPKVIVFYNFNYELAMLRDFAERMDILCREWNGQKHELIPTGDRWMYLVQYTAGAEGWNCIETDTLIFYSQNYSYKIMQQSAGRIDRMNTPFTDLYYFHLRSSAPIDLAILKALKNKKDFNESRYFMPEKPRVKNIRYNR